MVECLIFKCFLKYAISIYCYYPSMNPHYCSIVFYLITSTKRKHPGNDRIMILYGKKKRIGEREHIEKINSNSTEAFCFKERRW